MKIFKNEFDRRKYMKEYMRKYYKVHPKKKVNTNRLCCCCKKNETSNLKSRFCIGCYSTSREYQKQINVLKKRLKKSELNNGRINYKWKV